MSSLAAASPLPWRARLATLALFFANGFGIGTWAADIPQIKAQLGLSEAALSVALLSMAGGAIVFMPLASIMVGRLGGSGRAVRYSAALFALLFALPGLCPNLAILAGLTFLIGASSGLMDVQMNANASVVERNWGAALMSSFHAAWSFGGLAGAAVAAILIQAGVSTPWLFIIAGALILAMVVAAMPAIGEGDTASVGGHSFAWPERKLVGLCIVAFLGMLTEGAMTDWSAVYLTGVAKLAPSVGAAGFAAFAFSMLLGRVSGDFVIRVFGRTEVIVLGAIFAAIGIMPAILAASPAMVIGGFCLVGLGVSNMVPAVFSASAAISSSPALGISMAATVGYGGNLIGPPLIGGLASLSGLRFSFILLAAAMLAIIPLAALSGQARRG